MKSLVSFAAAVAVTVSGSAAQPPSKPAHRFTKITDTLYGAIATGTVNTGSNAGVIINDKDVLIVDSHITPASARALVQDIKALTDKPIRFVVNTHFHFDHAHGNQIFGDDVLVIGHEFTREKLAGDPLNEPSFKSFTGAVPGQIENLQKQVAAEADATKKKDLQDRLEVQQAYAEALKELKPQPPNVTVRNKMTLYRGGREIQIMFFGRGHTGGDVVVYLPKEKVLYTGDLLWAGAPGFMGDGYLDEWAGTLDELKTLDFEAAVPGHGEVIMTNATARGRIAFAQSYMKDLWAKASEFKARGVAAVDAAKQIDMTNHKTDYPQLTTVGVDLRAVTRIYQVIDERAKR